MGPDEFRRRGMNPIRFYKGSAYRHSESNQDHSTIGLVITTDSSFSGIAGKVLRHGGDGCG